MSPRRRLSERLSGDQAQSEALVEGIPPWLLTSLQTWLYARLTEDQGSYSGGLQPSHVKLTALERTCRIRLDWRSQTSALESVIGRIRDDNRAEAFDIIDAALGALGEIYHGSHQLNIVAELIDILESGGSAWTVAPDENNCAQLQRRVEATATAAALEAQALGRPGDHLRRAWSAAFGREPNRGYAYSEAVKAVEAAGAPVIEPANTKATLGTMIAALRDKPSKWVINLKTPPEYEDVTAFRGMLELLWKAQHDRHGIPSGTSADDISQHEAEAAVHLAVTCVLWLERGVIVRSG